jgi:hypothetical protein
MHEVIIAVVFIAMLVAPSIAATRGDKDREEV